MEIITSQNKGRLLFTSDWHFFHKNIVNHTNRGDFTTAEDHDEWAIELWNSLVDPEDTVYHIGDFCFHGRFKETSELIMKLNGKIILLKGNHDSSKVLKQIESKMDSNKVVVESAYLELDVPELSDMKINLLHFPMAVWNKSHYGSIQ